MRNITLLFTLIALLFAFPSYVYSHVLKSDGSVGAVLHIDPSDDPVAGQPSNFYFEFKDTKGSFNLNNCDCTFTIFNNDEEIYSQQLALLENSLNGYAKYSFPDRGIYSLQVDAKPLQTTSFQPFTLTYTIRIEKTSTSDEVTEKEAGGWSRNIPYFLGGILVISIFVWTGIQQSKKGGEK